MTVREAYTHWAATYDSVENSVRDLDQIVTRQTLQGLRCNAILELGCGTGKNSALLAEIGDTVQAVDFSEGMMALARAKVSASNVAFASADITQPWPFASQSYDLIVCNLVLEHIDDLVFVFAEAQRCLSAGGRLFVCELHPFRQYQGVQANFAHEQGQILIPAFVHHVSDFLTAAGQASLVLDTLQEWWSQPERIKPPLLVSFMFRKP